MSGILIAVGAGGVNFPATALNASDSSVGGEAVAQMRWFADGSIRDHNGTIQGYWILPDALASSSYEVRANSSSPDTPENGTVDTWQALSSTRTWDVRAGPGFAFDSRTFTVDIRIGSTIVSTRNVTLTADSEL